MLKLLKCCFSFFLLQSPVGFTGNWFHYWNDFFFFSGDVFANAEVAEMLFFVFSPTVPCWFYGELVSLLERCSHSFFPGGGKANGSSRYHHVAFAPCTSCAFVTAVFLAGWSKETKRTQAKEKQRATTPLWMVAKSVRTAK